MSGRNRGRQNTNQDDAEEKRLWKEIRGQAATIDEKVNRSNEIGHEIIQVEAQQAALISANKPSNAALDERLEKLYRENVRLCEEVQHMLEEDSSDMNILTSVRILSALKSSNETAMAEASVKELSSAQTDGKRTASGKLSRVKKASKSGSIVEDADVEPAPSPRLHLSARNAKDKSRQNSIPTTREASVKLEADGAESVASSTDIPPSASTTTGPTGTTASKSGGTRPSNRLVLTKGEIVFCRHPQNPPTKSGGEPPDGEGILCRVTAVIGEGKQRRYEVQDADTSSDPPPPQRASVSQLIQIPESNKGLSDLGKGRQVLAQYPDTTTFYKAEVQDPWRDGKGSEWVRLRFEDDEQAREVERRFVLTEK